MKKVTETISNGHSYNDTILAFKLENWQVELLDKAIKSKGGNNQKFHIYSTDVFTDIFAIPHFIAFINFEGVCEKDRQTFWDYWKECRDDVSSKCKSKMPLTHILNCKVPEINEGNDLYINRNIFDDSERLRLTILQEIKNIEGKRRPKGNESDKVVRILFMYKHLVYKGWLTKEIVDQWIERRGEKSISVRTFLRDMGSIRNRDGNVFYNKYTKRYELNLLKK